MHIHTPTHVSTSILMRAFSLCWWNAYAVQKSTQSHKLLKMELCIMESLENGFEFCFDSQNISNSWRWANILFNPQSYQPVNTELNADQFNFQREIDLLLHHRGILTSSANMKHSLGPIWKQPASQRPVRALQDARISGGTPGDPAACSEPSFLTTGSHPSIQV